MSVEIMEKPNTQTPMLIKYNVSDEHIATLKAELAGLTADTPERYEIVRLGIAKCRDARVGIEKTRVDLKRDALEFGRKVDAEAKRLTSAIEDIESPLKAAKKEVDEAEERKRKAKEEAERIEREAVAKAERIEQERLAEIERREAEATAAAEKEARKAARAPDHDKIEQYITAVASVPLPKLSKAGAEFRCRVTEAVKLFVSTLQDIHEEMA